MLKSKLRAHHLSSPLSLLVLLLFVLSSCVTQRKLEYVRQHSNFKEYSNSGLEEYKLKPKDELYIQISSLDEGSATITSNSRSESTGGLNAYGAALLSHVVDKDGFLELPVVGKIQVKDKTLIQTKAMIKEALANVLNQPVVSVKLVNTFISVLGEVRLPGHYVYSEDKLTIFDALGLAGDITDYGNRKKVILIRNEEGKNVLKELNLLKPDILTSNDYYVRPGDIIYVKPMRGRFWGFKEFPFGVVLSAVTTSVLIINLVQNWPKQ